MTLESKTKFADRLGINKSHLSRRPPPQWLVMDGGLVNVEESLRRRDLFASTDPHHVAHALKMEEERSAKAAQAATPVKSPHAGDVESAETMEAVQYRRAKADADKREEEAKTARLQRQILEGEYAHVDIVRFALKDHSAQIMGLHENVADRLTPLIDPLRSYEEKHAAISEFMTDLQREIHDSSERSKRMLGQTG